MKVVFYAAEKQREMELASAFRTVMRWDGHAFERRNPRDYIKPYGDLAIIFGVKGLARQFIDEHRAAGIDFVFIDKSHTRQRVGGETMYRIAMNDYMPQGRYFRRDRPLDRWLAHGRALMPRRIGTNVVIAGPSQKMCNFAGLGDCTTHIRSIVRAIRKHTDRPIVYRPKPSWRDAVPIEGTAYAKDEPIADTLRAAHSLVTYSSNASIDALIEGTPIFLLGPGVGLPVANERLDWLSDPWWPSDEHRLQFLADVAYCQFSIPEFRDGTVWEEIKSLR